MEDTAVTKETGDVIAEHVCKINRKDCNVTLTNSNLQWHAIGSRGQKDFHNVRIEDVLSTKLQSSSTSCTDSHSLHVSYVKEGKKHHLKSCTVVITCDDSQRVKNLYHQVSRLVGNVQQRPKKLLVLINPVSGGSKGRNVYERKVAPIFRDAGIETEVIVTERAHHTEEILFKYNIKAIDGLVLVGGDGLYHEAVNGLMQKLAKEEGIDLDNPDVSFPEIQLRIGLIPCGTGNGIALECYGNYDVVTAALSIAIGYQMDCTVSSAYSGGKLVAFSILLIGYGTWGDLIYSAESRRHLGRLRYAISMLEYAFIHPLRRLNLTIQSVAEDKSAHGDVKEDKDGKSDEDTANVHNSEDTDAGNIFSAQSNVLATRNENVIGATVFMLNPTFKDSYEGRSELPLFLNKSPLRRKFVSFLFDLMMLNFDSIERREDIGVVIGKEWTVTLNDPNEPDSENGQLEHILNIDGEIYRILQPGFKAKLLPHKLKLFSNKPSATKRENPK